MGIKKIRSRVILLAFASLLEGGVWRSPSIAGQGEVCETPGACVYTITCSGPEEARVGNVGDIAAAVKAAHRGDTIKLEAGCKWSSSAQGAVILDNPPGNEGYVTITTTEDDKLPHYGTRITPAYLPFMPRLVLTGGTGPFFHLSSAHEGTAGRTPGVPAQHWKFTGLAFFVETDFAGGSDVTRGVIGGGGYSIWSGNGTGLNSLQVQNGIATMGTTGAHHLRPGDVVGVYGTSQEALHGVRTITAVPSGTSFVFDAPGVPGGQYMSDTVYVETPPTEDYLPDNIIIDRILTTQTNWMGIVRRMISVHARRLTIRDSFLEGAQHPGSDSQTIYSVNGSGPYTIENNYIGSAAENMMFGGSAQTINKPLTGSVIRFNYFPHPPERYWTLRWRFLRGSGLGKDGLVFKGRPVRPNSGTSVYIATNTGVIGDSEPDWSQCQTGTSCTVQDGGVTWRRFGTAHWIIKNNFEIKSARDTLLSHNVFEYMWFGGQETAINIKSESQTKFPKYMNGCVPTFTGRVNTNGTTVTRLSGTLPFQYVPADNYGIRGRQISINGIPYTIATFDSPDSLTLTSDAGLQMDVPSHFGAPLNSPCFPDWNNSTQFISNIIRNTSRPFKFNPGAQARRDMAVGLTLRNNLMTGIDAVYWHNHDGNPYQGGIPRSYLYGILLENTVIEHNTFDGVNGVSSVYLGDFKGGPGAIFRYNVLPAGSTLNVRTAQYDVGGGNLSDYAAVVRDICDGENPCPTSRWDGNVFAGGNVASFTAAPGRVWNLCGSTLPFLPVACGSQNAAWDLLFDGRANGSFRVKNEAEAFKRVSAFGQDIGADINQLPEIRELSVTATDRMALFHWQVTDPIADTPCVLEVNTSPDFDPASYAGELRQIGGYYRQDADDHERYPREGLSRTLVTGHSVPLAAETQYFYRLQCGGDARTGHFRTLSARSDVTERNVTYEMTAEGATTLEAEYGTAYSRSTGEIRDGGTVAEMCGTGNSCTVRIPIPPGSVVYYRLKEKNGSGDTLKMSEVRPLTE